MNERGYNTSLLIALTGMCAGASIWFGTSVVLGELPRITATWGWRAIVVGLLFAIASLALAAWEE